MTGGKKWKAKDSSRGANGRGTRARVNDVTELSARYENSPSGQEVRLKIRYRPDLRGGVNFESPAHERRRLAHVDGHSGHRVYFRSRENLDGRAGK